MKKRPAFLGRVSFLLIISLSALLAQNFILSGPVYSQQRAESFLEEGMASYNNLYINEAITKLNKAIQLGLKNKDNLMQAYRYLGQCYAVGQKGIRLYLFLLVQYGKVPNELVCQ